ncbi:hypothetical protein WR25_10282 [Diploscapter pachys]|uniref:Uncharacterized protein n=1 Tax=Diploscapter pachys TaxID=2018661 RepID=A0A2A2M2V3_9BILA|nr:hypothetical protein WR25_10282 [Diploscapter pachys]
MPDSFRHPPCRGGIASSLWLSPSPQSGPRNQSRGGGSSGKTPYFASAISFAASAPAQSLPPFQRHTSLPAESNSTVVGRFAFHPSDSAI